MNTHFGFKQVPENEKQKHVADVFHSVANHYDVMNDLMSLGLHRYWKKFTFSLAKLRLGYKVLDIAGGTGDMSLGFSERVGSSGEVWLTDINSSMLRKGRDRLLDQGHYLPVSQVNAEYLPFPDDYFDCVCVSFGLRNMTHKDRALQEMRRVLKPGGRALVLEFSKIHQPLSKLYDAYSFGILPRLGGWISGDSESYRYLAESIRMHPDQETLKTMMYEANFSAVDYYNLSAGIVALHVAIK
jgi:demethylmenaquinone methyltransferase/2-methoxy-6-polyprenyl-1,4-benzoquinol methylase